MVTAHARSGSGHTSSIHYRIFHAFVSISSAVLLIRVVGMLNQVVVTSRFGAGAAMDAYFVASGLPILAASLVTGALEASVIPAFTRLRSQRTPEQISVFFSTLLNALLLGTVVLTLMLLLFRQQIIFLVAPALDPARMQLAVTLAPFVFPTFVLLTGVGFLEDVLNAEGQFGWPAYAGALVPITTIIFVLVVNTSHGVVVLCVGTLAGLVLQMVVVLIRVWRARIAYRPVIHLREPEIALVLAAAWPALSGALISRASPIIDQIFASFLTAGNISALNYSLKLLSVPTGIVFAAIGRAVLPYLSRQAAANDLRAFKATLRLYLWMTAIVTAGIAIVMFTLAPLIVRMLFQRGAFTAADTSLTAVTLRGFVVGLVPMALGFVTARAFSALRKTRMLMYTSLFSVTANAVFDYIFVRPWHSFGIALATSAVYFCTMLILFTTLRREIGSLELFKAPPEFAAALRTVRASQYYPEWADVYVSGLRYLAHAAHTYGAQAYAMTTTQLASLQASITALRNTSGRQRGTADTSSAPATSSRGLSQPRRERERFSMGGATIRLDRRILIGAALLLMLALGIGSVYMGTSLALRIAVGVPLVLIFLRYPYVLLIFWICLEVLSGSSLSVISGTNLQTALTVPSLLLLFGLPLIWTARRMPALAVMLLFLLWVLAGIRLSDMGVVAFLKSWTLTLDFVAVSVLVINVPKTRRQLMGFIDAILAITAPIALYGIYGYITHSHGQYDSSIGVFRASSIFQLATGLSFHLSLVIPLAFYRAYTLRGIRRLAVAALTIVLVLTLVLTFTRAALIAVALSIITLALFLPSRRLKVTVFGSALTVGALLLTVAPLLGINIFSRFYGQDLTTLNGRIYLWRAIINHFDPSQVLGHGVGASDALLANLHIGESGVTSSSLIGTSPHSLFLGIMYDNGIVGVTLLTLTFIFLLITLAKGARSTSGERGALFATALAVCVAALAESLDSNQILIPSLGIYFWIIMALPFAALWRQTPSDAPGEPSAGTATDATEWPRGHVADSTPLVGVRRVSR